MEVVWQLYGNGVPLLGVPGFHGLGVEMMLSFWNDHGFASALFVSERVLLYANYYKP